MVTSLSKALQPSLQHMPGYRSEDYWRFETVQMYFAALFRCYWLRRLQMKKIRYLGKNCIYIFSNLTHSELQTIIIMINCLSQFCTVEVWSKFFLHIELEIWTQCAKYVPTNFIISILMQFYIPICKSWVWIHILNLYTFWNQNLPAQMACLYVLLKHNYSSAIWCTIIYSNFLHVYFHLVEKLNWEYFLLCKNRFKHLVAEYGQSKFVRLWR